MSGGATRHELLPLDLPLIDALRSRFSLENTALVLCGETGARTVRRALFKSWSMTQTAVLTTDQFKTRVFPAKRPLLRGEKRMLAFFSALDRDARERFNINNYFQARDLGARFFSLMEELNEAVLHHSAVLDDLSEWQAELFSRLLKIKDLYRARLERLGFDDPIFLRRPETVDPAALEPYERWILVNPPPLTRLEREIVSRCGGYGLEVILLHHSNSNPIDEDGGELRPFTFADLGDGRNQRIEFGICPDEISQLAVLLQGAGEREIGLIADAGADPDPERRFLSPAAFNLGSTLAFYETSIYRFLSALHIALSALRIDPERGVKLLPLGALLDALLVAELSARFEINSETLDRLYDLVEEDYKVVDLDGEFIRRTRPDLGPALAPVLDFFTQCAQVRNIRDFIDLFDASPGFRVREIVTPREHETTDLLDSFYRLLSDFNSIEQLGLSSIPLSASGQLEAAGIVRLFLDFIRDRPLRRNLSPPPGRIELVDIDEAYIRAPGRIAVTNLVEGVLPPQRTIPFLFTEEQRRRLGLVTHEERVRRARLSFFRLVLSTPEVFLIGRHNMERNVELSSAVEEMRLNGVIEEAGRIWRARHDALFDKLMHPVTMEQPEPGAGFFTFPAGRGDITPDPLRLNSYSLKKLLEHPFAFFLEHIGKISQRRKKPADFYTPRQVGQMVHTLLNAIWDQLLSGRTRAFAEVDLALVERVSRETMRSDFNAYYCRAHDATDIYFQRILLPLVQKGIVLFFRELDRRRFDLRNCVILPEQDHPEGEYKIMCRADQSAMNIEVRVRGRADLRIEKKNGDRYIFDYKTGGYDFSQLALYELYYYLLEDPDLAGRLHSFFIRFPNAEWTGLRTRDVFRLQRDLIRTLDRIARDGFALPEKKSALGLHPEITRAELYQRSGDE